MKTEKTIQFEIPNHREREMLILALVNSGYNVRMYKKDSTYIVEVDLEK